MKISSINTATLLLAIAAIASSEASAETPLPASEYVRQAGEATHTDFGKNAFALSAPNLTTENKKSFFLGNSLFNQNWVTAPASADARDGLGPLFNANSCSACHFRDGRAAPPVGDEEPVGLLIRLSLPNQVDERGGPAGDPVYGGQIQPRAILGHAPEASVRVVYREIPGQYPDGTSFRLRAPAYRLEKLAYGPLTDKVLISPRIGNTVAGIGLLEAIPEEAILAHADPEDRNGDGISGRPNRVWDIQAGRTRLGRFGWKANQPSILQQTAGAFAGDIGITSELFPEDDCTPRQGLCKKLPQGGRPELTPERLRAVERYLQTLGMPARRNVDDPAVRRGRAIFYRVGCQSCHVDSFTTGSVPEVPEISNQRIHPYTDLLLHDMGEALADGRPDFEATGREWRTAPLWGLGLISKVNGHSFLLHDGRARDIEEAILWHGGEAERSKQAYMAEPKVERKALISFLESL